MSKIICDAFFFTEGEALKYKCATPITVSSSFQAALTPWLLTLAAEKYEKLWSTHELKSLSLSPTFQFTRSLSVYFLNENNDQQSVECDDLFAPLFFHLKELYITDFSMVTAAADGPSTEMCNRFDNGAEVADFVLKFKRLQKLDVYFAATDQTSPFEIITFYLRLFHSQSISRTLLVSVIESHSRQLRNRSVDTKSEYAFLIKQNEIIPYFVRKMLEFFRSDHGESLCLFLKAIRHSFFRSEDESTETDSTDELVPMLDLIETIVLNGDLLHPCFQGRDILDPQEKKWYLSILVSQTLDACLHDANYSRLDFMRRYGRTLLPKLVDFVFSMYDGSKAAVDALSICGPYFFARLMDDFYWTDEVESRTDSAGIRKMLDGGRKLLQHIPFDRIAFAIAEAVQVGTTNDLLSHVGIFLHCLTKYWKNDVLCSDEFRDAFTEDVISQLKQHNIGHLCVEFISSCSENLVNPDQLLHLLITVAVSC